MNGLLISWLTTGKIIYKVSTFFLNNQLKKTYILK